MSVAVAMDEASFKQLADQNIVFRQRHRDITVTLTRVDPDDAYRYFERASEMEEAADVMLLKSEWVNEFAASGYLMPAEAAFAGTPSTEQFDAISAQVKWNDYMWGVPLDIDPYVFVWNKRLLRDWLGDGVQLPLTVEQWGMAAARSAETSGLPSAEQTPPGPGGAESPVSAGRATWLSLDPRDPYALLAWLENFSGERTDALWKGGGETWEDTQLGIAMSLLDSRRAGVQFASSESAEAKLLSGETLVAALPYSAAVRLLENDEADKLLLLDRSSWKLPYIWPRGTCYVVSADTDVEEAAFAWIAEMTSAPVQISNEQLLGRLPVYRSIYDNDSQLSNLLPSRAGQSFPNQASAAGGPQLPARLKLLSNLWESYATGQRTLDDWKLGWSEALAELQDDD
ncbi:extracellular solute-binding protein [Cohnella sp. GCM10027633]|uniref:extracellular solute-binding protein n=1 Tax=unclassified Cohnella TaxID=2636738 RepID=UPI003638A899